MFLKMSDGNHNKDAAYDLFTNMMNIWKKQVLKLYVKELKIEEEKDRKLSQQVIMGAKKIGSNWISYFL